MFATIGKSPPDKILGVMVEYRKDPRPFKVDLSVGVYRDEFGNTPILASVAEAERRLLETQLTKTYVGLEGDPGFCSQMRMLALGDAVAPDQIAGVQAAGGSGALRIIADILAKVHPGATVWLSDPTWSNHEAVFQTSGIRSASYPYYDRAGGRIAFSGMKDALGRARPGDILLLHGCCHNPSGADLTLEQWADIAALAVERELFPVVDIAYQGFGADLDGDAAGLRLLARQVPEMAVAASCSKNFGVYRDRVGCALVKVASPAHRENVQSQLANIVRRGHSMPPAHGASVVRTILEDPDLRRTWVGELDRMRQRIVRLRGELASALNSGVGDSRFDSLRGQRGLFSLLNLTPSELAELRSRFGVYVVDDGRINIAGLLETQVEYVANAIVASIASSGSPS